MKLAVLFSALATLCNFFATGVPALEKKTLGDVRALERRPAPAAATSVVTF